MKKIGILLALWITMFGMANSATITVPLGGDIQAAIDVAGYQDTIFLVSGTYNISNEINIYDPTFQFVSTKELKIIGAGANVTYLDGGNSSYIFFVGPAEILTIESLTISNGEGKLSDPVGGFKTTYDGGGIYSLYSTSLTLKDVVIENCNSDDNGGALCVIAGNLELERTYFLNNSAAGNGGGIFNVLPDAGYSGFSAQISKSSFNGNVSSGLGEAIYVSIISGSDMEFTMINSTIGSSAAGSAAVYYDGTGSFDLTMQNNTIANNLGGGIYFNLNPSNLSISNNIIVDNVGNDIGSSSSISILGYRNLFEKLSAGVTFTGKNYYEAYNNAIVSSTFATFNGGTVPALDLTDYGVRIAAGRAFDLFPSDDQNGITRRDRTDLGAVESTSSINVWLGSAAADQVWSNPDNWTSGAIPSTLDDYIIIDNCNNINYPVNSTSQNLIGVDVVIGNFGAFVNNSTFRLKPFFGGASGTLYLMSNSSGTGQFLNNNTMIGNIEIEQYLFGPQWNFLGVPVSSITASSIIPGATLATSTPNGNSYTYNEDGDFWIFEYNQEERAQNGASDLEWEPVNSGNLSGGKGYIVWCDVAQKAVFTGSLINTITHSLTYTESGLVQDRGWNLVSNPYLAPFTWDNSITTDVEQASYFFDNNYQNYFVIPSDPIDGSTEKIPQVQAFFVKANDNESPNLDMPRSFLSIDVGVTFKNATLDEKHSLKATLFRDSEKYYDETYIRHKETGVLSYEGDKDAYKLKNLSSVSPQIYTNGMGTDMTINSFSYYDYPNQAIPLMMSVPETDTFKIALKIDESMGNFKYVLEDKLLGSFTDLSDGDTIKVYIDKLVEKSRFMLHVASNATNLDKNLADGVMMYSHNGKLIVKTKEGFENGEVNIYDVSGKLLLTDNISTNRSEVNLNNLRTQFVVVTYNSNNERFVKKLNIGN